MMDRLFDGIYLMLSTGRCWPAGDSYSAIAYQDGQGTISSSFILGSNWLRSEKSDRE